MKRNIGYTDERFAGYCRKAASEGIILLKNDDKVLPITSEDNIAVFGRCQIDYYRSGTGSGGAVNVKYSVSFLDGLKANGKIVYNKQLAEKYEAWVAKNPFDKGSGEWACEPWFQKEMPLTNDIVKEAKKESNKAVVVIGRTAGEDQDNKNIEGSYLLTKQENDMIDTVCKQFSDVVLVINVANIVDLSFINDSEKSSIKAIVNAWQGGQEGGNALVDVVCGIVNPSGKLPDTIAYNICDYPSDTNFGSDEQNIYQEDIYVGYRYFETFAQDKVMYEFGYGLSYTTFDIQQKSVQIKKDGKEVAIDVEFCITNTGKVYSGKEVVQVYLEKPQGSLGQPARQLVAFKKSCNLKPGESQIVKTLISLSNFASFDDNNKTQFPYSFILEKGEYKFHFGSSVRNTQPIVFSEGIIFEDTIQIKQCESALANKIEFERMKPEWKDDKFILGYEVIGKCPIDMKQRIYDNMPNKIEFSDQRKYKLKDVESKACTMDEFIAQLNASDLASIVRGEGMCHPQTTPGTAAAFGGVAKLKDLGVPLVCCADGPSGIRMDSGHTATQLPIGTLLASTWDIELVKELYSFEGKEMVSNGVDVLLGPGMNIHRHPLNGRNFEYFSEDVFLTGMMASAVVNGIQSEGVFATLKHFAANDQETNRYHVDSVVSQRALREVHLKCFEICLKNSDVKSIMTTYNPLNGIWTASSYDLNTTILRKDWGYDGIVMTDWWAQMNDPVHGGKQSKQFTNHMVRAQNDLYMVVEIDGAELNKMQDNTIESLSDDSLTIAELQRSAKNILSFTMLTPAFKNNLGHDGIYWHENSCLMKDAVSPDEILVDSIDDFSKNIYVDQDGKYELEIEYKHDGYAVAQSGCNVLLNGEFIFSLVANGTQKELASRSMPDVYIKKGYHTLSLEFMKKGIYIKKIKLKNCELS